MAILSWLPYLLPIYFLKSRVYAKLLTRLILECYQTFNGLPAELEPDAA